MIERVRWGILSTAAINDHVLSGCAGTTELEFVAVASRDPAKARRWADARGIPSAYGSYEQLLDDPKVEAVYISLPNSMHVEWAIRALEAGKHVLCEKPLSRDPDSVDRAFDVADEAGKMLVEGFMYRFHLQTAEIRRLIEDGAIGELRHLCAAISFAMESPSTDVRALPALDGGSLMDVGCYCVSAFRLFAGEPACVDGYAVSDGLSVDGRFVGTLVSENGVTGQFDCGMTLPRRDALELVGRKGIIVVRDPWHCRGAPFELELQGRRVTVRVDQFDAYRAEFEAVSCAIRNGSPVEFGREDAVAQATSLAALYSSAEAKRKAASAGTAGDDAAGDRDRPAGEPAAERAHREPANLR